MDINSLLWDALHNLHERQQFHYNNQVIGWLDLRTGSAPDRVKETVMCPEILEILRVHYGQYWEGLR